MKQPKNLNFGNINDIMSIFRTDFHNLVPEHNQRMIDIMKKADKNATVHFYPLALSRKEKIKTLADWCDSMWQQAYFSIFDNKLYYALGRGSGSGTRESHNFLINAFLQDDELRKKDITTAVVVAYKKEALAYYFHKGYAYVNHDVGSNWGEDIRTKIAKSGLSYSEYFHPNLEFNVNFSNSGEKTNVYHTKAEDISNKNFYKLFGH